MPALKPISLPPLDNQAERLIALGVHELTEMSAADLRAAVAAAELHPDESGEALLVTRAPATALAPLMEREGKCGFVVPDMTDLDDFAPIETAPLPEGPLYLMSRISRGDDMLNWTPNEALPRIAAEGRTPLTITEGVHLLLQRPEILERGRCFMTIGSRLVKPNGALDARTPALWISNGTGRDGRENKNAPKVGWCWAGNRHTWLGIASAQSRSPLTAR